jgi:hypothetical protein
MSGIDLLTTRERQVWELREAGRRNGDIARLLKISTANVSVTYHNARQRLAMGKPCVQKRPLVPCEVYSMLKPADVRRCTACELRGHKPGDPDRCWPAARAAAMSGRPSALASAIAEADLVDKASTKSGAA